MIKKLVLAGLCSLLVAGFAVSQSMLESATAAAGGSAAGVAGKKVSQGIDSVFTKVGSVTKSAADTEGKDGPRRLAAPIPPIPVVPAIGARQAAAPAGPAKRHAAVTAKPAKQASATTAAPVAAPEVEASPVTPAPAEAPAVVEPPKEPVRNLSSVAVGASRDELSSEMGKPAGKVTFSGDEGFVEIYKFKEGSVRLINGKVSEVKPNR